MAEYARSRNGSGTQHQWVDWESVMVLDAVTGEPKRFGGGHNAIGTFADALEFVTQQMGSEGRLFIVKLQTVRAFPISAPKASGIDDKG